MVQLNAYLTFAGNCREAMTYYRTCLGGELVFQTIVESPMAEKLPTEIHDCILHATLKTDGFVLMGSDMAPEEGLQLGNAVSLMMNCPSEEAIRTIFDLLSDGGRVKHPLENTFWGALFGDLTDKFGNNWILNFYKNNN